MANELQSPHLSGPGESPGGSHQVAQAWRRYARTKGSVVGLRIVLLLFVSAAFAPYLAPHSPKDMGLGEGYQPPSVEHVFGTDKFGRDVLSRIIFGARVVVHVALGATLLASTLGIVIGLTSGYLGGTVDDVIMRLLDVLLAFPAFLLAIALVAFLGASATNIIIVVAVTRIPRYARLIRGTTLSVKEMEYVEAARGVGGGTSRILFRHILPNSIGPILVYMTLTLGDSILTIAGLSFLGLGIQPPASDWGVMLTRAQQHLLVAPWLAIYPGVAIFVTVMGFNLMGDGLRDALDPQDTH